MMPRFIKLIVVVLFFLSAGLRAQEEIHRKVFYRLSFSPVVSFYQNNLYHTASNRRSPGYNFSFLSELRTSKQTALLTGLEIFIHGLSFNSYYFSEGSTRLYNGNFDYHYRVYFTELLLPLLFHYHGKSNEKFHTAPYFNAGYNFRFVPLNYMSVRSNIDGAAPFRNLAGLSFEHPFLYPRGSSFLVFALGGQKNFPTRHKALFIEASFKYSLTRMLINERFTANSLFIRNHHLLLTIGCKL